jgi:hypothetical protein
MTNIDCCEICMKTILHTGHLYDVHSVHSLSADNDNNYHHIWLICDPCSAKFGELTHTNQICINEYEFNGINAQGYADFAINTELKYLEKLLKIPNKNDTDIQDIKNIYKHLDILGSLF